MDVAYATGALQFIRKKPNSARNMERGFRLIKEGIFSVALLSFSEPNFY